MSEIRLLTAEDERLLHAWLMHDPLYNLFMLGDLELLGIDAEDLRFWGEFAPGGALIGVAMRYRVNWCFDLGDGCDYGRFAELVDDYPDSKVINGHPRQVDPIVAQLQRYVVHETHASYYCRLPMDAALTDPAWPTRRATTDDVDALVELYATAGMMQRDAETIRRTLTGGRIFVTEVKAQIVSAALTTVETCAAAMIGGVFTPLPGRNQGYASAAMTQLCAELITEAKQPCLFYDNPAAGTIYRRLGFQDIGPWSLTRLEPLNR